MKRLILQTTLLFFVALMTKAQFKNFPTTSTGGNEYPNNFTIYNGELYFSSLTKGKFDYSLWKVNPNTNVTTQISDITPETKVRLGNGIVYNEKLYFSASDTKFEHHILEGTYIYGDFELWVTDGTDNGTFRINDINQGAGSSSPKNFLVHNGKLFFTAMINGDGDIKLFESDGTEAGTKQVTDIYPGGSDRIYYMQVFKDDLYFGAQSLEYGSELYKYDGDSVHLVSNISGKGLLLSSSHTDYSNPKYQNFFEIHEDELYFGASTSEDGNEVWSTSGSNNETFMRFDINPNGDSYPLGFKKFGNKLVFFADDGIHGYEPWVIYNGEATLLKDINPSGGSQVNNIRRYETEVYKGKLYFTARDDNNGVRLWRTDGTPKGTEIVKDSDLHILNRNPTNLTVFNGKLYFKATTIDSMGFYLHAFDGQSLQQVDESKLKNVNSLHAAEELIKFDNCLYYTASYDWSGSNLWAHCPVNVAGVVEVNTKSLTLFPNPASNSINIKIETSNLLNKEYCIVNMMGQVVINSFLIDSRETIIDLSGFPNGVYLFSSIDKTSNIKFLLTNSGR